MNAEQAIFAVAGPICLIAAASAVTRRDPLSGALSLTVTLFSLAVLFLGLGAPFLAGVQVAVYGGAIMVLLIFVIMLLGVSHADLPRLRRPALQLAGPLIAAGLFTVLAVAILRSELPPASSDALPDDNVAAIADVLFGRYLFAFEAASVLLLAALVGAVVVARKRSTEREWPGRR
ncbi:MAG TPA: NADH-quinone oxidoreductase subunit J [Candidatus Limnocylindria bacterium]|nr:NADH-quinone oxidoreductase subunit J [Candidatus Limnocylindria bacterium]